MRRPPATSVLTPDTTRRPGSGRQRRDARHDASRPRPCGGGRRRGHRGGARRLRSAAAALVAAVHARADPRRSAAPLRVRDRRRFVSAGDAGGRAGALAAEVSPIPKTLETAVASGTIDEETPSLFQAMEAAGESAELTIALAQIFAGEIDFNTEVQPGDRFALTFERFVREERPATYGDDHRRRVRERGSGRFAPSGSRRPAACPAILTSRDDRCGASSCGRR